MEPVFMILGQSAATAGCLGLDRNIAVQDLPYDDLEARLLADGQVLEFDGPAGAFTPLAPLGEHVIDDTAATLEGPWRQSGVATGVHRGYFHDDDRRDGSCRATFRADLPPGHYEVQVAYPVHPNRAANVPITLTSAGRTERFTLNQRHEPGDGVFHTLAVRPLSGPTSLLLSNEQTDGHVIADAVRFRRKEPAN